MRKSLLVAISFNTIPVRMVISDVMGASIADFLFREQNMENDALKTFFGLLIGSPFDDFELKALIKEMFDATGNFVDSCLSQHFFIVFEDWIKSNHCRRSRGRGARWPHLGSPA